MQKKKKKKDFTCSRFTIKHSESAADVKSCKSTRIMIIDLVEHAAHSKNHPDWQRNSGCFSSCPSPGPIQVNDLTLALEKNIFTNTAALSRGQQQP